MEERTLLKVSKRTSAVKLGSMITRMVEKEEKITLRAVGAEAINQAVKGIATAIKFTKENCNKNIAFIPYDAEIDFNGEIKKAMEFDIVEV